MPLESERPENADRALEAWRQSERQTEHHATCNDPNMAESCHHEHGQLWITCLCGASWSVVDAIGPGCIDGFDFEQVSEGEIY